MAEVTTTNGDPALAYLSKQRESLSSTLNRLKAQHKGVEAKMTSTEAKLETIEEAITALTNGASEKS